MVLPQNLSRGFFNNIAEKIKSEGEVFLAQTHTLDPPVNLLCVSQSDLPQNRILLEVLDGSIPVQYKHVCVMLTPKTSSEVFVFKAKVFSFDKYKLVPTKIRYLIVISNVKILDGEYADVVDTIKDGLAFHPLLTIQQIEQSNNSAKNKVEPAIYQNTNSTNSDNDKQMQNKNQCTNDDSSLEMSRQAKIQKNEPGGPVVYKNFGMYTNISELNIYTPKWTIQARLIAKCDIKKFSGPRGESQLFSMELCDSSSEIRATVFGDAVNKWYSLLEEGKVYSISKGQIRTSNKKFNHLNHPCEIILDENAIIQAVNDDNSIPFSMFNFVKLSNIDSLDQGVVIDVIGVVCQHKEIQSLQKKGFGGTIDKRDIKIGDETGSSIWVSLWHEKASTLTDSLLDTNPVLALKNVKITDWQTRKLDVQNTSKIVVNPQHPQAELLNKWWIENGRVTSLNAVNVGGSEEEAESIEHLTSQATQVNQDVINQGKIYSVRGLIEILKENVFSWPACPGCRKKMIQETTDSPIWKCSRCNVEGVPIHTYMLSLKLVDTTQTSIWASAMGNVGEEIMGGTRAEELIAIIDSEEEYKTIANYFEDARLTEHVFKLRMQMDTFLGEVRIRYRIVKAVPLEKVLEDEIASRLSKITELINTLPS